MQRFFNWLSVLCITIVMATTPFNTSGINFDLLKMSRLDRIKYEKAQVNYWTKTVNSDPCKHENCCTITEDHSCSFASFPKQPANLTTYVYPSPELMTQCMDTKAPFKFQVVPGQSDKVVFYFQGGGACLDDFSTNNNQTSLCFQQSKNMRHHDGVFARDNPLNPFINHTIVHVLYCSGDYHVGDAEMPFFRHGLHSDDESVIAEHRGVRNVRAVLDWLKNDPTLQGESLEELIVTGCSAGSFGVQFWAHHVLSEIKAKRSAVIVDSFMGIFPSHQDQVHFMKQENLCGGGLLEWHPELQARCLDETLDLGDVLDATIEAHPNTIFTAINAKKDIYQIGGYVGFALYRGFQMKRFSPFYRLLMERDVHYSRHDNYVSYWINGVGHCLTNSWFLYRADIYGKFKTRSINHRLHRFSKVSLLDWVGKLPLNVNETIHSQCAGQDVDLRVTKSNWGLLNKCDIRSHPSSFTRRGVDEAC